MARNNINSTCKQCGETFYTVNQEQQFCSNNCGFLYKRHNILKICEYCGKEFRCSKSQKKKKYCSQACYFNLKKDSGRVTKNCRHCGDEFSSKKSAREVFCSLNCYSKHPKHKSAHGPKRIPKPCEICGEIISNPSKRTKFCSTKCQHESYRIPKIDLICTHCKKNYQVQYHRTNSKFCSDNCKYAFQKKQTNEIIGSKGYVQVRSSGSSKYRAKHRVVMEAHLGRPLKSEETIHHINQDKKDNRLENLIVLSQREHGIADGSLGKVVNELLERGIIEYDRKQKAYCLK